MIRFLFLTSLIIASLAGLIFVILQSTGVTLITLNQWSVEMKTATLLISLIVTFFAINILWRILAYVFSIRTRLHRMNSKRLSNKASKELIQGLLLFAEGHWNRAEKLLLKNAERNETPVTNYLAAARAAHLQEAYERRDNLLKQAIELDNKADIVVSVSQAEMQMDSEQVAQAQATLLRLQDLSPNHPYITKLLAKVYYKQKNWSALFDLMPMLLKQKALKETDIQKLKTAAIKGLFNQYAEEGKVDAIQKSWKKLPHNIRKHADAVLLYAESLHRAGAGQLASTILVSKINETWDERLVELYGKLPHTDPIAEGDKAKKWLELHRENPVLLLTLARLNAQKKLWGKAKTFYENSLNMKPNTAAYLELAQLLQQIGESDNANTCYRIGLQYCIDNKAERLNLKSDTAVAKTNIVQPIDEDDDLYSV
jgi:HemY protein